MNGSDVHILPSEYRQSMVDQLTFKLNIDKALKDVTSHFDLKLFHLFFLNGQIKHGDNSYHY